MEGALTSSLFNYASRKSHEVVFLVSLLIMVLIIISIYLISTLSFNSLNKTQQLISPEDDSYPQIGRYV